MKERIYNFLNATASIVLVLSVCLLDSEGKAGDIAFTLTMACGIFLTCNFLARSEKVKNYMEQRWKN